MLYKAYILVYIYTSIWNRECYIESIYIFIYAYIYMERELPECLWEGDGCEVSSPL